jgi:hypothetical protein
VATTEQQGALPSPDDLAAAVEELRARLVWVREYL